MSGGFCPGCLLPAAAAASQRALASGALLPLHTEVTVVADGGIEFLVRRLRLDAHARAALASAHGSNPFLPLDPALFVADVSPTHVAVLNKFSVFPHHLLVITRAFVEQQTPLTRGDLAAVRACLRQMDGLAFYNSGPAAGASQRHRHLQLVPLPLAPGGPLLPVAPAIAAAAPRAAAADPRHEGRPLAPTPPTGNAGAGSGPALTMARAPGLPYEHRLVWWGDRLPRAETLLRAYRALRLALGVGDADPYNLLLTAEWMLMVPRRAECFESISVNALGFAGALLVRSDSEFERVRQVGPCQVLRAVSSAAAPPTLPVRQEGGAACP